MDPCVDRVPTHANLEELVAAGDSVLAFGNEGDRPFARDWIVASPEVVQSQAATSGLTVHIAVNPEVAAADPAISALSTPEGVGRPREGR
jgi:hypothetical protein